MNYTKFIETTTNLVSKRFPFVLHCHNARNTSVHYDLRFLDPKNSNILHSFALPSNFLDTINTKSTIVKTKDHDPRWLTLKSYRLEVIDSGECEYRIFSSWRYFDIEFFGKKLQGRYQIFRLKSKRGDYWLMKKSNKS